MTYYTFNFDKSWQKKGEQAMQRGLARMVIDIHNMAVHRAPVKTGALVNSGRYQKTGPMTWTLTFGNSRVRYAWIREHFNRLHPSTTYYLGNSVKQVAGQINNYFKDII